MRIEIDTNACSTALHCHTEPHKIPYRAVGIGWGVIGPLHFDSLAVNLQLTLNSLIKLGGHITTFNFQVYRPSYNPAIPPVVQQI